MVDEYKQLYKERILEQENNLKEIYALKLEREKEKAEKRIEKEKQTFKSDLIWIGFAFGLGFFVGAGFLYGLFMLVG